MSDLTVDLLFTEDMILMCHIHCWHDKCDSRASMKLGLLPQPTLPALFTKIPFSSLEQKMRERGDMVQADELQTRNMRTSWLNKPQHRNWKINQFF